MKQIVVATDFSSCAGNAMEYAVELANILKTELCTIHAIHPTEGVENSVYRAIFIEDYHNSKRQALAEWTNNYSAKYPDMKVTAQCEVGSLSHVLTKHIDAHEVELLVMGTMGATGITGLFGSNASMMVEKTKTPTLVIPLETKFSSDPSITLATDFSTSLSSADINVLNEMIQVFHAQKITVLNIVETHEFKTNEAGENDLKTLIKNTELDFRYVQEDNAKEGLLNYLATNNADLLCVVKRHHNMIYRLFNRSTVTQVMNRSVKAVLVLHE